MLAVPLRLPLELHRGLGMFLNVPRRLIARSELGRSQFKLREVGPGRHICINAFGFPPRGRSTRRGTLREAPRGQRRAGAKDDKSFNIDPRACPAQASTTTSTSGRAASSRAGPRGEDLVEQEEPTTSRERSKFDHRAHDPEQRQRARRRTILTVNGGDRLRCRQVPHGAPTRAKDSREAFSAGKGHVRRG